MSVKVSAAVQAKLSELVASLVRALQDDLVAVLAHGSAARGGWTEGSDVDLVVVVRDASRARLEAAANALQLARWSARIEAMILVEAEIPRAADVFPVFYADLQRHHAVLHGRDPFASLVVERHHLRLRIEQELREIQIRLRRVVVDAMGAPDALRGAVARKLKQARSPLAALLALKSGSGSGSGSGPGGDALGDVLRRAAEVWKVDGAALARVAEDPSAAHDALVALLEAAIADVDAMEDAP